MYMLYGEATLESQILCRPAGSLTGVSQSWAAQSFDNCRGEAAQNDSQLNWSHEVHTSEHDRHRLRAGIGLARHEETNRHSVTALTFHRSENAIATIGCAPHTVLYHVYGCGMYSG